jgi:dTDP-glucose 4,6-dehydratase
MKVVITGGAGFIGSSYVRQALAAHPDWRITVLDKLTYAGSRENLPDDPRLSFIEGDICDAATVQSALAGAEIVIHMAAESHVDRSIMGGREAVQTNVVGTFNVLEAARALSLQRFVHVSTDEVYGAITEGLFTENSPLNARNPYSASKAAGDRLAYAYFVTYGLPVLITRPCNNYGPRQYPEKLVPFFVYRALHDEPLPVYGDGMQVRDWLHVEDHCRALDTLLTAGELGQAYNIPAGNERTNMETIRLILDELGKPESLIRYVTDRPGHDVRYALDGSRIAALGWKPEIAWEQGMRATVRWFVEHRDWLEAMVARSAAYFAQWYKERA